MYVQSDAAPRCEKEWRGGTCAQVQKCDKVSERGECASSLVSIRFGEIGPFSSPPVDRVRSDPEHKRYVYIFFSFSTRCPTRPPHHRNRKTAAKPHLLCSPPYASVNSLCFTHYSLYSLLCVMFPLPLFVYPCRLIYSMRPFQRETPPACR